MKFEKRGRCRGWVRMTALLLAVWLMSFAVLGVSADETATTVAETEPVSTEETEPEAPPVEWETVDKDELKGAKENLMNVLGKAYGELFTRPEWSSLYCRSDVLESVEKNTDAARKKGELLEKIGVLLQIIPQDSELPQELAQYWWDCLAALQGELQDEDRSINELISELDKLKAPDADTSKAIVTEELGTLLTKLADLESTLDSLQKVLDAYPEYSKAQVQLAVIRERVETVAVDMYAVTDGDNVCAKLFSNEEHIQTTLNTFFSDDVSAADRQTLPEKMVSLKSDAEAFPLDLAIGIVMEIEKLGPQMDALKAQLDEVNAQQKTGAATAKTLGIIGIGLGGVGMIMGILAVIFSLRGRKEENEIDISQLAARETVETLNRQNRQLRETLERVEHKVSTLEADAYRESQDKPDTERKPVERQEDPEIIKKQEPVKTPAKKSVESNNVVCTLRLEYQPISPSNSYLVCSSDGDYILYDDGTVTLRKEMLGKTNELSSWRGKGMFYLFDPEVDGRELSGDMDIYPRGFYAVDCVVRRARVEESTTDNYRVVGKGLIRMES